MVLEIKTLYLVSISVGVLIGLLLLIAWLQQRAMTALAWWGGAMVLVGVGLALIGARGMIHHIHSIAIGNALIALAVAAIWTGARVLERRSVHWAGLFAGAAVWLAACLVPAFYGSINARTILISAILGIYTLLTAYEFWQRRGAWLLSRQFAVALLVAHGVLFLLRIPFTLASPMQEALPGSFGGWYLFLVYETILYKIALGFALFAMAKDGSTRRVQTAAAKRVRSR
jgi:hypothetical protein